MLREIGVYKCDQGTGLIANWEYFAAFGTFEYLVSGCASIKQFVATHKLISWLNNLKIYLKII